jgi:hypothetical protein
MVPIARAADGVKKEADIYEDEGTRWYYSIKYLLSNTKYQYLESQGNPKKGIFWFRSTQEFVPVCT